jgi:hypothetical protein
MERAALAVRRSDESNVAWQQSSARLNCWDGRRKLATMVKQMVAYYPHQELAAETVAGYMHDLTRLAVKDGLPAVKSSLLALRIRPGQKFFPRPSEAREELAAMTSRAALVLQVGQRSQSRTRIQTEPSKPPARVTPTQRRKAWR